MARLPWIIRSINSRLEELRELWAKTLGISGPQYAILSILSEQDRENGVPVNVVSRVFGVESSFVTTQSKILEKKGYLCRKTSTQDARVVQMSLTDKARKHLNDLADEQTHLNKIIFTQIGDGKAGDLMKMLLGVEGGLKQACLKVVVEADPALDCREKLVRSSGR